VKAVPTVVETTADGITKCLIALGGDLSTSYRRDTVIVHGNVALATHGETVQQLLGSGQAGASFQRFTLAHDPLTYVQSSSDPSGAVDTLDVRVNDVSWAEVPTLFAPRRDRAYAVRTDETGDVRPVRRRRQRVAPPDRRNNVQATYRKGLGAAGNVGVGQLAQLIDRPLGVKGVSNPSAPPAASTRRARTRRGRRSRSACARSAARCRCSTTRTSPARSAAWRRRTPPCSLRPGGRSCSRSRSRAATGSTT
jgi:hypothetical protein